MSKLRSFAGLRSTISAASSGSRLSCGSSSEVETCIRIVSNERADLNLHLSGLDATLTKNTASSSIQLVFRSLLPMFWGGPPVNRWDVESLRHLSKLGKKFRIAEKAIAEVDHDVTLYAMETCPSPQPLGFVDVELRVPWLEVKGNSLSRLEVVIAGAGFHPVLVLASAHCSSFPTSRAAAHSRPDNLFKAPAIL
jgi:hypothetical protein